MGKQCLSTRDGSRSRYRYRGSVARPNRTGLARFGRNTDRNFCTGNFDIGRLVRWWKTDIEKVRFEVRSRVPRRIPIILQGPKKGPSRRTFFLERCVFSTSICTTGTKAPRKDVFLPFYFQETNSTTENSTVPRERAQKVTLRVSKSKRAN